MQALIDHQNAGTLGGEISLVVSNRKNAYGIERAQQQGIDTQILSKKQLGSAEAFDQELLRLLAKSKIDLVILAGYLNILTPSFIAAYRNRILNIHPSLIPSFCGHGFYGMHVHEAVVKAGVKITGATVHFVDEGTDTGAIVMQEAVHLSHQDTPEQVQQKVLQLEHKLLPKAVALFCADKLVVENEKVKLL